MRSPTLLSRFRRIAPAVSAVVYALFLFTVGLSRSPASCCSPGEEECDTADCPPEQRKVNVYLNHEGLAQCGLGVHTWTYEVITPGGTRQGTFTNSDDSTEPIDGFCAPVDQEIIVTITGYVPPEAPDPIIVPSPNGGGTGYEPYTPENPPDEVHEEPPPPSYYSPGACLLVFKWCGECSDPGEHCATVGTTRFSIPGNACGQSPGGSCANLSSVDFRVNLGRLWPNGQPMYLVIKGSDFATCLDPVNVKFPAIQNLYELEIWHWFAFDRRVVNDLGETKGWNSGRTGRQYVFRFIGADGYKAMFAARGIVSVPLSSDTPVPGPRLVGPVGLLLENVGNGASREVTCPLLPYPPIADGPPISTRDGADPYADGVMERTNGQSWTPMTGVYVPFPVGGVDPGVSDKSLDDYVRGHWINRVPFGGKTYGDIWDDGADEMFSPGADPLNDIPFTTMPTGPNVLADWVEFASTGAAPSSFGASYCVRSLTLSTPGSVGSVPGVAGSSVTVGPDVAIEIIPATSGFTIRAFWRHQAVIQNGVCDFTGKTPFAVWAATQPTANSFHIQETRDTLLRSHLWERNGAEWKLTTTEGNRRQIEIKRPWADLSRGVTAGEERVTEVWESGSGGQILSRHAKFTDDAGRVRVQETGANLGPGQDERLISTYSYRSDDKLEAVTRTDDSFEIYKTFTAEGGAFGGGDFDVTLRPWQSSSVPPGVLDGAVSIGPEKLQYGRVTMTKRLLVGGVDVRTTFELIEGQIMTETVETSTVRFTSAATDPWLDYRDPQPVRRVETRRTSTATGIESLTVNETFIKGAAASLVGHPAYRRDATGRVTVYHHYRPGAYVSATATATDTIDQRQQGLHRMTYEVTYDDRTQAFGILPLQTDSARIITDPEGRVVSRSLLTWADASNLVRISNTRNGYDNDGNLRQTTRDGGIVHSAEYLNGRKTSEIDETGTETTFSNFDSQGNAELAEIQLFPQSGGLPSIPARATNYQYDALGRVRRQWSGSFANEYSYDSRGRLVAESEGVLSGDSLVTSHSFSADGRTKTTTLRAGLPSAITRITSTHADGQVSSTTGTAGSSVVIDRYVLGTDFSLSGVSLPAGLTSGFIVEHTKTAGETSSIRIVDGLGRTLAGYILSVDATGALNGSWRRYVYDAAGRVVQEYVGADLVREADHVNGIEIIKAAPSPDQIRTFNFVYSSESDGWWRVSLSSGETHREKLTGLTPGESASVFIDQNNRVTTRTVTAADGVVAEVIVAPGATNPTVTITRGGLLQSVTTPSLTNTVYEYDGLGRQIKVIAPGQIITTTAYDAIYGRPSVIHTEGSTIGEQASTTTTLAYQPPTGECPGAIASREVDGRTTLYTHNADGTLRAIWGADYPQRYEYQAGRLHKLHTYREHAGGEPTGNGDVTTWAYKFGLLQSKTDAAGKSVTYSYNPAGRLHTRIWARGVTSTYTYDRAGQLREIAYSDSTPATAFLYDALGRVTRVEHNQFPYDYAYDLGGANIFIESGPVSALWRWYQQNGQLNSENASITSDVWGDPNTNIRGETWHQRDPATGLLTHMQHEDGGLGLENNLTYTSFTRVQGTEIFESVQHPRLTTPAYISKKYFDGMGRLMRTENSLEGGPILNFHEYTYTNGLRSHADSDRGRWIYTYNDRAELTAGNKRIGANDVPGFAFAYDIDTIGNRRSNTVNGNTTTYEPTSLNQYDKRHNPGILDIRGHVALDQGYTATSASVHLNGALYDASPFVEGYFASSISVDNTTPRWETVKIAVTATNDITSNELEVSETRKALVPPALDDLAYDLDGNLVGDALHEYTYDAENRLIEISRRSTVWPGEEIPADMGWGKLRFKYDYLGRRMLKEVYDVDNETLLRRTKFVYSNWRLMAEAEYHHAGATPGVKITKVYHWGPDLSGTLDGAGGVGGLLYVHIRKFLPGELFGHMTELIPSYDGNGNIVNFREREITSDSWGFVQEEEYGPFGESLRPRLNSSFRAPFGWSTKYTDEETGLVYYGYRYYSPQLGRWINRDPIAEAGGINLLAFVKNHPTKYLDPLGRSISSDINEAVNAALNTVLRKHVVVIEMNLQNQDSPAAAAEALLMYRKIDLGGQFKMPFAGEMMTHWLGNTGKKKTLKSGRVKKLATDPEVIKTFGQKIVISSRKGKLITSVQVAPAEDTENYFALNRFELGFDGDYCKDRKNRDLVVLDGTWSIKDRYDWNPGESVTLAGVVIRDDYALLVENVARAAKSYDVDGDWEGKQTISLSGSSPTGGR